MGPDRTATMAQWGLKNENAVSNEIFHKLSYYLGRKLNQHFPHQKHYRMKFLNKLQTNIFIFILFLKILQKSDNNLSSSIQRYLTAFKCDLNKLLASQLMAFHQLVATRS